MATQTTYVYEDASDNRRFIQSSQLSFTGTWQSGTSYGTLDVADYQANQWVVLTANAGQTPPAGTSIRDIYWSQLIEYQSITVPVGAVTVTADGLGTPI